MDFTSQRNDDLMRAYREQLALANYIIMPEIFEKVAESPARRFWVSEERAAVVVARMLVGKPFSGMRQNKFLAPRDLHPDKSLFELVSRVVHQPAPKFYLTPRTVGEFIYHIKNGWYDKQFDRYRQDIDGE